jgi:DNA-binding Lrp family transcriptional regulator
MQILTQYEKQIIELLIQNEKTLSEISNEIGISKPATSKYLKKLEEQRIIKGTYERNNVGRSIRYRLQKFHLVFSIDPKNKIIVGFKANEPLDVNYIYLGCINQKEFREEVKEYLKEIISIDFERFIIILYGSVARGSAHRKSDIDLLFLKEFWSKKEEDLVLDKIASAANKCSHLVKPLFKSLEEFEEMDKSLKKQIKEYGIILYEKGNQWERVKQQLIRYKTITI